MGPRAPLAGISGVLVDFVGCVVVVVSQGGLRPLLLATNEPKLATGVQDKYDERQFSGVGQFPMAKCSLLEQNAIVLQLVACG